MTPTMFRRAVEVLYGPRGGGELARQLEVSDRTVRYWLAGRRVPPGVAMRVRGLLVDNARAIERVLQEIER